MPKLILLSGLPGAGKTTLRKLLEAQQDKRLKFISSDELRLELFGHLDQTQNDTLWKEVYRRAKQYGKEGYDVMIDSLAINQKDRRRTLSQIRKYFTEIQCVQVITPISEILKRNQERRNRNDGTDLPDEVLLRKLVNYEFPMLNEGFTNITFVYQGPEDYRHFHPVDYIDCLHDNPHHNESIGSHIMRVVKNAGFKLAEVAKYHDSGKPYCKQYNPEKGYYQYIGHANVSTYVMLTDFLDSYWIRRDEPLFIDGSYVYDKLYRNLCLVKYHDLPFDKDKDQLIEYFTNKAQLGPIDIEDFVNDLLTLHEADKVRVNKKQIDEQVLQAKVEKIRRDLIKKGYNVVYVGLYGSQNYNVSDDSSDIDVKAIVSLSLREIIERKSISTTVKTMFGDADVKDVLTYEQVISKGNCQYIEALHTNYWAGDENLRAILSKQVQNIWALYGFILEKKKAMTHEYPSKTEEFKNFGCDPKQYHHILRLYKIFKDKIPYFYTYTDEEREEMIKYKRGMNGETLEEKLQRADAIADEIRTWLKETDYEYKPVDIHDEVVDFLERQVYSELEEEFKEAYYGEL